METRPTQFERRGDEAFSKTTGRRFEICREIERSRCQPRRSGRARSSNVQCLSRRQTVRLVYRRRSPEQRAAQSQPALHRHQSCRMSRSDLPALTIADLQSLLRRKEISPREVIDSLRARIEKIEPKIDAYLSIDFEAAAKEAEKVNVDLPLGGVPIAIKDIINVKGQPCTCASKILANYRSPYDATVIQKLRSAGAIPFGKTNMDEFAMGSSTENSSVKVTRNPWDMSRVPGGSSGGSAAAVAADAAFGGLGTDTGGSIRQPAALSGIVGLKPTYGRVSRFGLVAFASSLDQIGPLTKTVRDAALIMNAIAGHDLQDTTALNELVPDYNASLGYDC